MTKTSFLTAVLMAAGVLWAHGQLVFEKTLIEVKLKPDEMKAAVDFPFKVEGDKEVVIAEYDAPCSCLEAKISDNGRLVWKPGETGVVKGLFDMGNFVGTIDKMIVLRLKGESKPSVKLTVRLHIPEILVIKPEKSLFWEQGGKAESKSFKVSVNGEDPVRILDVSGTNDQFAFKMKTIREGREYEIVVTPTTVEERAFGLIRIRTDSKYQKHQRYQCFTVIRRPVAPRPAVATPRLPLRDLSPVRRVDPGKGK